MSAKNEVSKETLIKDIQLVSKKYKKQFPDSKEPITRDYYRSNGKYSKEVEKEFGSFKNVIKEVFPKNKGKSRDDIDVKFTNKESSKRYIVSAIVAGQKVHESFVEAMINYCTKNNAELILLVMRGVKKDDMFSNETWDKYSKYFHTEFIFNNNLRAMDFRLLPQQIVSLTGLDRIARSNSVIVAHTKQQIISIANHINEYPHLMYSTGVCTLPNYSDDRIGRIAMQDHTVSGLVVEVVDKTKFHIRNFQADKTGSFVDLGIKYSAKDTKKISSDYVMGDLHVGCECSIAIQQSKEIIKQLGCKNIYFNDLFDGGSVNHHEKDNMFAKYNRPIHQQTLENELNYLGNFLKEFTQDIEDRNFIVVASNHDDFVNRWLAKGEFVFDSPSNAKLGAELFAHYLDGKNPIEYYLRSRNLISKNVNIVFAELNDNLNSYGYDILHGHRGVGGGNASIKSFDRCYDKNVTAHTHSPKRFRGSLVVGTNSLLDQPYIAGSGSAWMHSDAIIYENGTDQLINKIEGSWKLN